MIIAIAFQSKVVAIVVHYVTCIEKPNLVRKVGRKITCNIPTKKATAFYKMD